MQTVQSSLGAVQTSLSSVPDLTTYIAALTPAVVAYDALGSTLFTDAQSQISSVNSTITSVRNPCQTAIIMMCTVPLRSLPRLPQGPCKVPLKSGVLPKAENESLAMRLSSDVHVTDYSLTRESLHALRSKRIVPWESTALLDVNSACPYGPSCAELTSK